MGQSSSAPSASAPCHLGTSSANLKREAQGRDVINTMSVVVCRLMGMAKVQAPHWSHERHRGLNSLGDSERR